MTTLRTHTTPGEDGLVPPPATRMSTSRWRDPRLAVGIVIVAACMVLGSRVVSDADDTVGVWRARHDLPAGSMLTRSDLEVHRVHLGSDTLARYFVASDAAPGAALAHDVAGGELLPRSAVTTARTTTLVEVPLSVAPDDVPRSVGRGAVVDVWVLPASRSGGQPERARLALDDVAVVAMSGSDDTLAPRTTQQVIVGVDRSAADGLADALGLLADGRVVLTRQAGS